MVKDILQVADHTDNAAWLGEPLPFNLKGLIAAHKHFEERLAAGETEASLIWKACCDLNPQVGSAEGNTSK